MKIKSSVNYSTTTLKAAGRNIGRRLKSTTSASYPHRTNMAIEFSQCIYSCPVQQELTVRQLSIPYRQSLVPFYQPASSDAASAASAKPTNIFCANTK